MWAVGLTLLLLGIILIILYPIVKGKNDRCSEQTAGVLRQVVGHTSDRLAKDLHVYSYMVDGKDYLIKTRDYSLRENISVGDTCTIWYNPAKPEEAMPFHYETNRFFRVLLILGLIFVPVGLVLICVGAALG